MGELSLLPSYMHAGMYVCMCACMCSCVHAHMPVGVHACMCSYVHAHMSVGVRACMCEHVHAHMCVDVHAWRRACVHACTCGCTHVYVCVCACTCACMCVCTCVCTCVHACMCVCKCAACMCVCVHVLMCSLVSINMESRPGYCLYTSGYNPALLYVFGHINPALVVGSSFSWLFCSLDTSLSFFVCLFVLSTFVCSGMTSFSGVIWSIYSSSPRISHFSKDPCLLLLENDVKNIISL